jgi:hypothetical protein
MNLAEKKLLSQIKIKKIAVFQVLNENKIKAILSLVEHFT